MKYLSIFFIGLTFFAGSCNTNSNPAPISVLEQLNVDLDLIDNWLVDNEIPDTLHHPSQIRYTINQTGTGLVVPQLTDIVEVAYEGRFLDTGAIFDESTGLELVLNNTISGWQIMVPEMKEGDKFTIYLPSLYGYGTRGSGPIPPNTVIVFDIELLSIRN